jgi:RNA polymerase sigma factor (sigma-70 family)
MLAAYGQESLNDVLARWMKDYGPEVLRTIRRRGVPRADAEDVLQEALIKAYRRLRNRQSPPTHPAAWLKKIAIRTAVDYFRKRAAEARCRKRLIDSGKLRNSYCPSTEDEREAIIRKLLALLDDNRAFGSPLKVVKWRVFKEYTYDQIADLLDVSAGTASRWHQQVLPRLRQALEDQGIKSLPEQW